VASPRPIVIVGAGLAGLTAAIHLAERGQAVVLCEAHPDLLGGRARGRAPYRFTWDGHEHTHSFDHGQHCMWAQYWNMQALLERLGIFEKSVMPCETTRYLVDDGEVVHRLKPFNVNPTERPPSLLHFFAHMTPTMRVPGWTAVDTARLAVALPRLLVTSAFRHGLHYDEWDKLSVHEMFAWIGLPPQMDQLFKSMCKASTFHPHTEISASWGLSMMESTMVGHREDHKMSCFRGDLGTHLIDPLAAALRARGGRILRNATAVDVERQGERIVAVRFEPTAPRPANAEVLAEPRRIACDAVVGATDIPGFQRWLLPAFADIEEIRATSNLEAVASVTIRVVTSRPVRSEDPRMGIFSGRFHTLDTYFILSRYQDEFVAFRERTGGEVIELHSYLASRELAAASPEVVRALVEKELLRAWPELEGHIVHVEYAVNERTFDKQGVGHGRFQPRMRTAVPNLVLCGSWIKIDDAVHDMEKAVVTGMRAANALLEERDEAPFALRSLRPRSALHRLAGLFARRLPMPPAVRAGPPMRPVRR
jgi:isorenieratene synthase